AAKCGQAYRPPEEIWSRPSEATAHRLISFPVQKPVAERAGSHLSLWERSREARVRAASPRTAALTPTLSQREREFCIANSLTSAVAGPPHGRWCDSLVRVTRIAAFAAWDRAHVLPFFNTAITKRKHC